MQEGQVLWEPTLLHNQSNLSDLVPICNQTFLKFFILVHIRLGPLSSSLIVVIVSFNLILS